MRFDVFYRPIVVKEHIPPISADWKKKIKKSIEEKLMIAPEIYGKPLRQSLKGYWKLRVGDYRVVYRIEKNIVIIIAIKHRSFIYKELR